MRKFWKNFSTSFFFIVSSVILVVSEFTPWINQIYSPWDLFALQLQKMYIYLFPLISSSITLILAILILFSNKKEIQGKILEKEENNKELRNWNPKNNQITSETLKIIMISITAFFAQSLNTLFLIEMFTENGIEINSYNYGVYLGIGGFAMLFWALFWLLIQETKQSRNE
jgi:hypothetical protein